MRRPTFEDIMFSLRATIATGGLVRSVLEIGNTLSRVPDGGRARQRCAPEGAITREAIKATSTPQRRMLFTRSSSHGHDERLCCVSPRRIGWVQIMHAGRQDWRSMGRQMLVLTRKSSGHIGRAVEPPVAKMRTHTLVKGYEKWKHSS